jgi:YegS/Rv2252/BmrU family lipid kinase
MTAISILVNGKGGAASRDPEIGKTVAAAFEAAGVGAEVELIDGGECEVRAKAVADRGDELVVVGGGDGTISAAASALLGTKTALGILPLGTLNHFARDLGIPTELEEAAALIAKGKPRPVDVAEMNGRVFINNSAIGLYPLMVLDRDAQQKKLGRSKRLAVVVASIRTLARFNHQRLTLTVNDEKEQVDTPLLFVGNNDYRLDLGGPGQRDSIEDGRLSVFVMRKKTRRGLIAAMIRVLIDRPRPDDMVALENVQRLRVSSHRSCLAVSLDGEVVGAKPPLDYKVRAKALRVIAP